MPRSLTTPDERHVVPPFEGRHVRKHAEQSECRDRVGLPLENERLQLLDLDRIAAESPRPRSDQNLAGAGSLLESRGDVRRVARDGQSLGTFSGYEHLTRRDARAHAKSDPEVPLEIVVQELQTLPDLRSCAQRPERVVLPCGGDAENRDDRVADELLDPSSVALDHFADVVEVPSKDAPEHLRVECLAEARGVGDVGEEHRHRLAELHARSLRTPFGCSAGEEATTAPPVAKPERPTQPRRV